MAHDREEKFNVPLFRKLGELGLLGITVPEEYGGAGLDATSAVIAHEELAAVDPGFAWLTWLMPCCWSIISPLTPVLSKKRIFCLVCVRANGSRHGHSEPAVGTDVLGMQTTAKRQGDKYILNGRKMWITNGCVDDKARQRTRCWSTRAPAKERQPSHFDFFGGKDPQGYVVGQKIKDKLGMRASNTAELVFDHCEVPLTGLIGAEGDSLKHMMRNLE